MAIEVVDYDDAWPGHAEAACAELRDCLRGPAGTSCCSAITFAPIRPKPSDTSI